MVYSLNRICQQNANQPSPTCFYLYCLHHHVCSYVLHSGYVETQTDQLHTSTKT